MEAPSTPQTLSQSALHHRQQEKGRQAKFFKLAVPIALVLHGITIGGGLFLIGQSRTAAIDEVEIIAGESPTTPDQTIDQTKSLAGGGGDPKLTLFQSQEPNGTKDGNNIAALGNPFAPPDVKTSEEPSIEPSQMPIDASTEPTADDTIDLDQRPIEAQKKTESKSISSKSTDSKNKPGKFGDLNGDKKGTDLEGNPNNRPKNPNLPIGSGGGAVTTNPAKPTNPIPQKPATRKPAPVPATPQPATPVPPAPQKPSVAIGPQIQTPSPKKPKCIENCNLDEYLGSEGKADIRLKVDRDGNVIEATLGSSSGNAEVDRKALEYAKTRKYQPSNEGFNSNLPVTSQQEGSDFARQQEERRRQEQADRALQPPEPRAAERPTAPTEPLPAAEPIANPIPEPVPEIIPKPVTPSVPEPIIEPIAPVVEPVVPPIVEPIAPEPAAPPPITPAPLPEPISETVSETVSEPIAPLPEPAPSP